MSTLTWRGLDLLSALTDSDREGLRIQIVRGFLAVPESRGQDIMVPAREGRDPGNRVADTNTVLLDGPVQARTIGAWRTLTDALLATLDENGEDPGDLIAGDGYLGLAGGDTATFTARVKNYVQGPILAGGTLQFWSIELESIDPYWSVS